jgi:signal transduction histidine kinase
MEQVSVTDPRDARIARLTAELQRSEARFRDVIERNADAILVIDTEGVICFANTVAAELFRRPIEKLVDYPIGFPVVAGETTELDLPRDGESIVVEMRVVDSEWDGRPACIATLRDATHRKRAEESARQLIREQSARQAADRATRHFRLLADASNALAHSLDHAAMLSLLPRIVTPQLADWSIAFRIDSGAIYPVDAAPDEEWMSSLLLRLRADAAELRTLEPVADVVETRQPLLVSDVTDDWLTHAIDDAESRSLLQKIGAASLMIVPVIAGDEVLGVLMAGSVDDGRRFEPEDLALARELAGRTAMALENARLYREAREANQSKTDFIALLSHDLRTPLNAILGYADLLAMGIPDRISEKSVENVRRIQTSASHLVYLIDQLLAYSRLEAHHEEVKLSTHEWSTIVDDVAAVIEPLAASRGLSFSVSNPPEPITLVTDADKLRQILLNLIGNSVKYTEKGSVRLRAHDGDGRLVIEVSDTGIGIAENHLRHIFEPFWQAKASERSPDTGTGLGLSVVKQLIDLLGGNISVASTLGSGTTFTVTLPLQSAATLATERQPAALHS